MSELKASPGAWSAAFEEAVRVKCSRGTVATVSQVSLLYGRTKEEVAANAHLIAAAPDLYEEHAAWARSITSILIKLLDGDAELALEMLEDDFIVDCDEHGYPEVQSIALAKARGEEV